MVIDERIVYGFARSAAGLALGRRGLGPPPRSSWLGAEEQAGHVQKFLKVSPYSPSARFHLIGTDWARVEPEAARWEKENAGHPAVLAALGKKYMDLARYDDAERLFRAAVKLSPDNRSYFALADIYGRFRKDEAKMLAVMEERLKQPDYGLETARMRIRIAEVYSGRKDYKTALSYAEKAAEESGAEGRWGRPYSTPDWLGIRPRRRFGRRGGGSGTAAGCRGHPEAGLRPLTRAPWVSNRRRGSTPGHRRR